MPKNTGPTKIDRSATSDVSTSHEKVSESPNRPKYASFFHRLGSFVIDYLILQVIAVSLLVLIAVPFAPGWFHKMVRISELSTIVNFIELQATVRYDPTYDNLLRDLRSSFLLFLGITLPILMVVSWLYYAAFDASKHQGTPGKLALGLKVTDLAGHRIGFLRATGRHFAMYLSALSLIGYLFPLWTEKKQTLHDLLAGCVVVKKN